METPVGGTIHQVYPLTYMTTGAGEVTVWATLIGV